MSINTVTDLQLDANIVFLRGDLDVTSDDDLRFVSVVETAKTLLEKGAYKLIIAGHKGRPEGQPNEEDSLQFLVPSLQESLGQEVFFVPYEMMESFSRQELYDSRIKVYLLENLRFWSGEKANDPQFVQTLAGSMANVYVNEAFASSHREHASIVGLPEKIRENGGTAVVGLRFAQELETLSQTLDSSSSPSILILSGVKKDKIDYLEKLESKFDKILIAGRLPEYLGDLEKDVNTYVVKGRDKLVVANLNQDKEDITLGSVEAFMPIIESAKTIVVSGPMGKYEEEGQRNGTQKVFDAIKESTAYKVAFGGDTENALKFFNVSDSFDWISVGGGASLEFLSTGTLPGIEALLG